MNGWIKLYREITDHWLWTKSKPFSLLHAWLDILLTVNFAEQKVPIGTEIIVCKRGESLKSINTWAERWGWNPSKVRRFLKLLQNDHMIEFKGEQNTTRLIVCNYDNYQDMRREVDEVVTRQRRGSDEVVTTNKKDKKEKEDIYDPPYDNFLNIAHADLKNGKIEKEDLNKYKGFIDYLFGKTKDNNIKFEDCLSLRHQINHEEFLKLLRKYDKELIKRKIKAMEDRAKSLKKDNRTFYFNLDEWCARDSRNI